MEDKIIEQKWEDGALADIADALDRARGVVKTADDIKKSSFSTARRTKNGYELSVAEGDINTLQRADGFRRGYVVLFYFLQLKHIFFLLFMV